MPASAPEPLPHAAGAPSWGAWLASSLRGSGQVIFMANPWTGLLNLMAYAWGAWAGGTTWSVALGALMGMLVATAAAGLLAGQEEERRAGLYGFNGLLVGAALPTFLVPTPRVWLLLVLACAASVWVTWGVGRALARWQLPGLTFPFIVTTWVALLAAPLAGLAPATGAEATLSEPVGAALGAWGLLRAALVSVAQVFFVDNAVSGALCLLGLALASRRAALLAGGGALLAVGAAQALGGDAGRIVHGLWGYSAVLTAVAVGGVFERPGARTLGWAALATAATVVVQGAAFAPSAWVDVPPLTFPFVVVTWVTLWLLRLRRAA